MSIDREYFNLVNEVKETEITSVISKSASNEKRKISIEECDPEINARDGLINDTNSGNISVNKTK